MEEEMKGRKTLVLDLDETLIHSCFEDVDNVNIILPVSLSVII
jgi:TFIIF-interacting CTD phosphatase-like protein